LHTSVVGGQMSMLGEAMAPPVFVAERASFKVAGTRSRCYFEQHLAKHTFCLVDPAWCKPVTAFLTLWHCPCASMQLSANRQQQTRSVVLFAKALTASDCCTSISKGGRITIPRVAVENNLPSVADKKHHEVVILFAKQDIAASQACATQIFPY